MKIYVAKYFNPKGEELGSFFTDTEETAAIVAAPWEMQKGFSTTIEAITVQPTKKGIIAALNEYGSHPDNRPISPE